MRTSMKSLATAVGLAVAVLSLAACGTSSADGGNSSTIEVGIVAAQSGAVGPFGSSEVLAAKAVVAGLPTTGPKIDLVVCDDKSDPTQAVRCATSLIDSNHVQAIIAATSGSDTIAFAPIAARASVPVMFGGGTSEVTDPKASYFRWAFRAGPNDSQNTPAEFDYIKMNGYKRLAIFGQDDAFGQGGLSQLESLAKGTDISVVQTATAPLTATDVGPQVTKLINAHPDVVDVHVSSVGLGAAFVRAAQQQGLKAKLVVSVGLSQGSFLDAARSAAEGATVGAFYNIESPTAEEQKIFNAVQKAGGELGFGPFLGASGTMVLTQAIAKVGAKADGTQIRDELESGDKFTGLSPVPYQYSPTKHDSQPASALIFCTVKSGKFTDCQPLTRKS